MSRRLLPLFVSAALAACGGSDGGSTSPIVVPSPTPMPTPTPTPAPTATARIYAASPMVGRLDFSNSSARSDGSVQGFTARDGRYFPGYLNAIVGYRGEGAGGVVNRDNSDKFKFVSAIDQETAISIALSAPPEAKMITPVTSLLFEQGGDAAKIKRQLGITGSLFGMVTDPNLATYDAITESTSGDSARAADAARMSAANIRVLAISAGLSAIGFRGLPEFASRDVAIGNNEVLSACLRTAPDQFIFTNTLMVGVAQCFTQPPASIPNPAITLRPMTWQAIAHLINTYAAALPVRVETPADRARWVLGLKGYLVPAIAQLAAEDSAPAATVALAVTTQNILNETSLYVDHYSYNATGFFMPGPDFLTIASGATQTFDVAVLRTTDFQLDGLNGGFALGGTIRSVSVPAAKAGELSATLTGTTVSASIANGFRGVTWFDYVTRSDAGEDRTARVYVRAY